MSRECIDDLYWCFEFIKTSFCPDAMKTLVEDDSYFSILKEYDEFARNNFHESLTQLNRWGQKRRESDRLSS